jgi:hypothetical protein
VPPLIVPESGGAMGLGIEPQDFWSPSVSGEERNLFSEASSAANNASSSSSLEGAGNARRHAFDSHATG